MIWLTGPFVLPGVDWSDHRSYWRAGYPALMVTDTAFLRNRAYHTDDDRPEILDYTRMAAVVRASMPRCWRSLAERAERGCELC